MSTAPKTAQNIDTTFTATIIEDDNSGWPCVQMPGSGDYFGTRKPVKVAGTIDGHSFQATMLPIGGGVHMLPVKAQVRKAVGKTVGDEVTVHLEQRYS
ncbi:DUF1905 domain-containing protein [Haloechinothrix sp. YIM 98757]|uniref:DUF1905 domain-containing protein n=1 Tax=Haloechinothrix aidingensis TaxID=2752311 RepID=A0A838A7U2_9PSEU|nr:DUF1905 domain-containing protein [Haloechinothrix aidingensis]MBA0125318.1 DUF1905 domain-containing protein [Haloechinothrix aidingensis]